MKAFMKLIIASVALLLTGAAANPAALCNCCDTGANQGCTTACAPIKPTPGQCVATVDHAGKTKISTGDNPLYDIPLGNMYLEDAKRPHLEQLRKLLEVMRRGVEKDRRGIFQALAKGKIGESFAIQNSKRYDDAIVNYYLGLQAYRDHVSSAPEK